MILLTYVSEQSNELAQALAKAIRLALDSDDLVRAFHARVTPLLGCDNSVQMPAAFTVVNAFRAIIPNPEEGVSLPLVSVTVILDGVSTTDERTYAVLCNVRDQIAMVVAEGVSLVISEGGKDVEVPLFVQLRMIEGVDLPTSPDATVGSGFTALIECLGTIDINGVVLEER